jgi:hypothetical protein
MTCTSPIVVDDFGTIFRVTVKECISDVLTPVDISGASLITFVYKKPDDTTITKNAVFTTDGTDGQIQYITIAADIDQVGVWCLQAEVTLPTGTYRTSLVKFDVERKL